jgi:8-oxo-dGTP diphosphatase
VKEGFGLKRVDVVGAVIIDPRKGVLCALRSPSMSLSGFWEFPGGKIEPGENPAQALTREIQEELGCRVDVEELIEDIVHRYPDLEVHLMTYKCSILEGMPRASEHEELRWVRENKLMELNWAPADIPTVSAILDA